jgi:RNA polymerase sigma-70 factor (ECF subfamily)
MSDSRRAPPSESATAQHALDAVVREFWESVMRFLWKRVSRAEAEDLAQDVFASVHRAVLRGSAPRAGDSAGWHRFLLRAARNRLISHWRQRGVHPPTRSLAGFVGEEETLIAPEASGAPAAPLLLLRREVREAIRDCMDRLDALSRAMCWLVFVEGRSKREAGRLLDRPEATVRAAIVSALASLRQCLSARGITTEGP